MRAPGRARAFLRRALRTPQRILSVTTGRATEDDDRTANTEAPAGGRGTTSTADPQGTARPSGGDRPGPRLPPTPHSDRTSRAPTGHALPGPAEPGRFERGA